MPCWSPAWAVPAVLPQTTLLRSGLQGRVYQTHGIATDDFIRLGKEKVEGTILAAGSMLVIDDDSAQHPIKAVTLRYVNAYEKMYGSRPATFGANMYDWGHDPRARDPRSAEEGEAGHRGVPCGASRCAGECSPAT